MCGLCQRGGRRRPPSPRSAHAAPGCDACDGRRRGRAEPDGHGADHRRPREALHRVDELRPRTGRVRAGGVLHIRHSKRVHERGTFGFDGKWTVARGGRALYAWAAASTPRPAGSGRILSWSARALPGSASPPRPWGWRVGRASSVRAEPGSRWPTGNGTAHRCIPATASRMTSSRRPARRFVTLLVW